MREEQEQERQTHTPHLELVGEMHGLVVDCKFLALVGDDQHSHGARTLAVRLAELVEEVALVDDLETLLDLTGLGHGDELAIVTDVDETVLLEDGAEERVEDHGGRRVRDHARLLMQLLGEEVNTKITVLASLSRGGDADDLAGALLKDHKVANADVVARDSEGGSRRSVDRGDGSRLGLLRGLEAIGRGLGGRSIGVLVVVVVLGHFVRNRGRSTVKKLGVGRIEVFKLVVLVFDVDVSVLDDGWRDGGLKGFGCGCLLVRGEGELGFI